MDKALSEAVTSLDEDEAHHGKAYWHARRAQAVTLAMAGLPYDKIGEELGVSPQQAWRLVSRTISETRNYAVDEMRQVENARLDRATTAIWNKVLDGDLKAIDAYLRIADRRARLNGLDAPTKVQLSVSIKAEMEEKLAELQTIIDAEVIEDEDIVEREERQAVEAYLEVMEA